MKMILDGKKFENVRLNFLIFMYILLSMNFIYTELVLAKKKYDEVKNKSFPIS